MAAEVRSKVTEAQGSVSGDPESGAYVLGCGALAFIEEGEFFSTANTGAPCEIGVVSLVEGRIAEGPAVRVVPPLGVDLAVRLVYPTEADCRTFTDAEIVASRDRVRKPREKCPATCEGDLADLVASPERSLAEAERARREAGSP
ncbi:MAG: hypothetical protein ACOZNI_10650 [Myxococcota bacterium]